MLAPLAVSVVVTPAQIVAVLTLMIGKEFTITVTVAMFLQLFTSVPVTVYGVVVAGVVVIVAIVANVFHV